MTWQPPSAGSGCGGGQQQRMGLYSSAWARDARRKGRKHSRRGKAAADMPRLLSDLTRTSRDLAGVRGVLTWATGSPRDRKHVLGGTCGGSPRDPVSPQGTAPKPTTRKRELFTAPQPVPPCGSPTPALHLSPSRLPSPHPGSQAVPHRPLLRAGEVLSQALYSYLYRAVINSQRLAAATRGGRFHPPATLQRQGLICLKHTPQPFHGDPFQFHGARAALMGNAKESLIYGSAFQSLLPSLSTLTGGSGESPNLRDVHQGQRLSRGGQDGAARRGCWIEVPVPPLPMSWSPPAQTSCR